MTDSPGRIIRIGCASGFWGDSDQGAVQLVHGADIDYLVFDYLAEITMALLSKLRGRDPEKGYVPDFVHNVIKPLAAALKDKNIKVVANAGGVNPSACAAALEAVLAEAGVALRVAAVEGDDVMAHAEALRAAGVTEMFSGAPLPERLLSMNAYLGATPIAAALARGADIVVTGRCVDSAVVLGPLMHEFGWAPDDYDRLAAGSLAGHIVECGTQATGGIFTDWRDVPGWDDMGFPIVECAADGSFVVTKPAATGGLVTPATVAEQVVYEIGDPARYLLPDVTCDFSAITLRQDGPDRVAVSGARGLPPTDSYKVSATYQDGYRAMGTLMIGGFEAAEKARAVAAAIIARCERILAQRAVAGFAEPDVEVLGAEDTFGPHARRGDTREVVLKIALRHRDREALEVFSRELVPSATSMAQGITGFAGGRPKVSPLIRLYSLLVDKAACRLVVVMDGQEVPVASAPGGEPDAAATGRVAPQPAAELPAGAPRVPLLALAHGRSGDKGDRANIGIMARRPEFVPVLRAALTAERVAEHFRHIVKGPVERFEWPGLHGFNFLLHSALAGGGTASLRYDPQGKALAQMLLAMPVPVPAAWLAPDGCLAPWAPEAQSPEAA